MCAKMTGRALFVAFLFTFAPSATVQAEEPVELHGFAQLRGHVPDNHFGMELVWLIAKAKPHPNVSANVILRYAGGLELFDAYAAIAVPDSSLRLRFGQFAARGAFLIPRPDQERLIGGPESQSLVTFRDIGVEVSGEHGRFRWAADAISGSGKNALDNNLGKDVVLWSALGPFGPASFQVTLQGGEQPDGWRFRAALQAAFDLKPVFVELVATHQRFANVDAFGVSPMVAWRVHEHLDTAVGYDLLQNPGVPLVHVARAQVTGHFFEDHIQVGLMYRGSTKDGHQALGRLQLGF